jgi:hypothetical protein
VTATVIIPWRGGCPHREAALAWVLDRYAQHHPGWDVVLGEDPVGPWVKADAVARGLARAGTAGVLVVADADVWCDQVADAVTAVRSGAPWAVPHGDVHRLTDTATIMVLAGREPSPDNPVTQTPYLGVPAGGITVLTADTYRGIPLDPRFVGWGQEDEAWGTALTRLAGPPWRGAAPLYHLWHPTPARRNRHIGNPMSRALQVRYQLARHPDTMRGIINEIRG